MSETTGDFSLTLQRAPARLQMSLMWAGQQSGARIGNYSERRACNLISGGRGRCTVNLIGPVPWPRLARPPGMNARDLGDGWAARENGRELLALARTLRRALRRVAGVLADVARLAPPLPDGAAARPLRVAVRGFLLMRRVRMILRLEVLDLVWRTLAIADHELSSSDGLPLE